MLTEHPFHIISHLTKQAISLEEILLGQIIFFCNPLSHFGAQKITLGREQIDIYSFLKTGSELLNRRTECELRSLTDCNAVCERGTLTSVVLLQSVTPGCFCVAF